MRTSPPLTRLRIIAAGLLSLSLTACATTGPGSRQAPAAERAPASGDTTPSIIPLPQRMELAPGSFRVTGTTLISVPDADDEAVAVGTFLAERIESDAGIAVGTAKVEPASSPAISLSIEATDATLGSEGYELTVSPDGIAIEATGGAGLFYGVQTLRQLIASGERSPGARTIPCLHIVDRPRYHWRGSLLDCGRHFMTKEFVKRYIDLLAYHKMNVLHWHLTEDQGWRIAITRFPKLTEIGAWRKEGDDRYGGFYTRDDVREIVAYAQSRYVTVVPEIEMPGHCLAALAAYPTLSCTGGPFEVGTRWGVYDDVYCAGKDTVFSFLETVLVEVMALFPSRYIHIGGDECPKVRWRQCANCQARIQSEGLKDEHELQAYFIKRIERFLNAHGRRIIGWDEILEGGVAPNATVQSWRGMEGAVVAAKAGHDVICSPTSHCYFDYPQVRDPSMPGWMGVTTLEKVYSFEPTPEKLTTREARHVLGAEGNIWTERAPQELVERRVYPRLCALAEVTWSPKDRRNWPDFLRRMRAHYRRLDGLGVTYFIPPPSFSTPDSVFTDALDVDIEDSSGVATVRYTTDGSEPTASSPVFDKALTLTESATVSARSFWPNRRASDAVSRTFTRQTPREPVRTGAVTPGLTYEYYEGRWERLPDFASLSAAATGVADTFALSMARREDEFGVVFSGYIRVPRSGVYSFFLTSDDGSRLLVGSDLVVDNDGMHGMVQMRGQIALAKGVHPITVAYFDAGGADGLKVEYEGPGVERKEIPGDVLMRE